MKDYFEKGAVVMAIAGREKNEIFLVLRTEGDYTYIINGKSRPIENPKKKNIKHLNLLAKSGCLSFDLDNCKNCDVIKFLKDYNKFRSSK